MPRSLKWIPKRRRITLSHIRQFKNIPAVWLWKGLCGITLPPSVSMHANATHCRLSEHPNEHERNMRIVSFQRTDQWQRKPQPAAFLHSTEITGKAKCPLFYQFHVVNQETLDMFTQQLINCIWMDLEGYTWLKKEKKNYSSYYLMMNICS